MWREGAVAGSIVSDRPIAPWHDQTEIDYYGGYLIADDVPLNDVSLLLTPEVAELLIEAGIRVIERSATTFRVEVTGAGNRPVTFEADTPREALCDAAAFLRENANS